MNMPAVPINACSGISFVLPRIASNTGQLIYCIDAADSN